MKTNQKLLLMTILLFSGVTSYASSALYLTENRIVDWIKEDSSSTYKIYGRFDNAPDKYRNRIVQKSEISLTTSETMDGQKLGAWALALNATTGNIEHCIIHEAFENKTIVMFCDIMEENIVVRHIFSGAASNFSAQVSGPVAGFAVKEKATLKKATSTIAANTKVGIRGFFANEKVLVQESGLHTLLKSPFENARSSVVDISDLEKLD